MISERWLPPEIKEVRAAQMIAYLTARGWRRRPFPRPEALVFEGPPDDDGEPNVQVVPASDDLIDLPLRVIDLISALSVIEDRHPTDILHEMLALPPTAPAANGAPAAPRKSQTAAPRKTTASRRRKA